MFICRECATQCGSQEELDAHMAEVHGKTQGKKPVNKKVKPDVDSADATSN